MPRKKTRRPKTDLARRLTLALADRDPLEVASRAGISKTAVYNTWPATGRRSRPFCIAWRRCAGFPWNGCWPPATRSGTCPATCTTTFRWWDARARAGASFPKTASRWARAGRRVSRPYDLKDANAFGVEVRGDSMSPRYENKEIVVCSPNKEWHSGDYCVVKTMSGEYLIKRVKKENGNLVLISIAHGYDPVIMPLSDIAGIYRIVWKKER